MKGVGDHRYDRDESVTWNFRLPAGIIMTAREIAKALSEYTCVGLDREFESGVLNGPVFYVQHSTLRLELACPPDSPPSVRLRANRYGLLDKNPEGFVDYLRDRSIIQVPLL